VIVDECPGGTQGKLIIEVSPTTLTGAANARAIEGFAT
jgi:hypothetical protein